MQSLGRARRPAYIEVMESETTLHAVPDDELLRRLGELVTHSRRVEADLVAHIGEVEERRLYAREASPSMFVYCTERLHLSEAEAYRRITVARAARKHEVLLAMLRDGRLHLTGIAMLAPLLTRDNRDAVLARATHRSKREIEELVAELSPRPDAPSVMRKLPEAKRAGGAPGSAPAGSAARDSLRKESFRLSNSFRTEFYALRCREAVPTRLAPPSRRHGPAVVEPLSPARYKVQFTASADLRDKLERLSALMRSEVPDGDLAAIIERAVTEKLERLEARRYAQTRAPRKGLGRPTHRRCRATSLPLSDARCASATATAAVTSTSRAAAARRGTGWSSTTDIPSGWEGTTVRRISACCARATTATLPSATTAARVSPAAAAASAPASPVTRATSARPRSAHGAAEVT